MKPRIAWGAAEYKLPNDPDRVIPGRALPVSIKESESNVTHNGQYIVKEEDKPGDEVTLHFPLALDVSAGGRMDNQEFYNTWEREHQYNIVAKIEQEIGQRSKVRCERLLDRLTSLADGSRLDLVRLRGPEVPDDSEMFFCWRTFTSLKVQVRTAGKDDIEFEYPVEMESVDLLKCGAYDFTCKNADHSFQVKKQPTLGLQAMLPGCERWNPFNLDESQATQMRALIGAYQLLKVFVDDETRESMSVVGSQPGAPSNIGKLMQNTTMFQTLCGKLPIKADDASKPSVLQLQDHTKPITRGKLIKAFFEVKMLLVRTVLLFRKDESSGRHKPILEEVTKALAYEGGQGGIQEHFLPKEETAKRLITLVCGAFDPAGKDRAWAELVKCNGTARNFILKLRKCGCNSFLKLPSMESVRRGNGVEYKDAFTRICHKAIYSYLKDQIVTGCQRGGPQYATEAVDKMCGAPDSALKVLCGGASLDESLDSWQKSLKRIINTLSLTGNVGSANANPRGATGLDNPGENLCATNALMQMLASAPRFKDAVLGASNVEAPPPPPASTEENARDFVDCLCSLFSMLCDPQCGTGTARDVAMALYGREIGQQQDSDELMCRVSSLLQDGLKDVDGDPYKQLRETFQNMFMGATYEMQVRPNSGSNGMNEFEVMAHANTLPHVIGRPLAQGASCKSFMTIPVQKGNQTLMSALEEFTGWDRRNSKEVLWVREQFRVLPPFLCFASRQVAALDWEQSLNLTRFTVQPTATMHSACYERAALRQSCAELSEALQHLASTEESLISARGWGGMQLDERVEAVRAEEKQVQGALDETKLRLQGLETLTGDGFDDPSLGEFLDGIASAGEVEGLLRKTLGATNVSKLSALLVGVDGSEDMLDDLGLSPEQGKELLERVGARQQRNCLHMYDVHALVIYIGRGEVGHYVSFVRQSDGCFLCFDDEHVSELPDVASVREAIASRGTDEHPASVRTLVYRRRTETSDEPLRLADPVFERSLKRELHAAEAAARGSGDDAESSAKRQKAE